MRVTRGLIWWRVFQYSCLESSHVGISIEERIHQVCTEHPPFFLESPGVITVFSALYNPTITTAVMQMLTLEF